MNRKFAYLGQYKRTQATERFPSPDSTFLFLFSSFQIQIWKMKLFPSSWHSNHIFLRVLSNGAVEIKKLFLIPLGSFSDAFSICCPISILRFCPVCPIFYGDKLIQFSPLPFLKRSSRMTLYINSLQFPGCRNQIGGKMKLEKYFNHHDFPELRVIPRHFFWFF